MREEAVVLILKTVSFLTQAQRQIHSEMELKHDSMIHPVISCLSFLLAVNFHQS